MCWRGPHAKGLKFPWRDLEQWRCICFVWTSMPIVAWYDFEMISRKSTVGARECVSFIHYDITYGKGCIAWNASVHICWSLMLWHIVAMMMTWFFLFFVHAYIHAHTHTGSNIKTSCSKPQMSAAFISALRMPLHWPVSRPSTQKVRWRRVLCIWYFHLCLTQLGF